LFKGIVSRDLGALRYRDGSSLFLILLAVSYENFVKELTFTVKSILELLILELLLFGGFFSRFDLADLNQRS
jgi:hypothetical protein